jgi:hypothetical protein
MRPLLVSTLIALFMNFAAQAATIRGVLLNDDDPWMVKASNGSIYKAEWWGGSIAWFQGDRVILTSDSGRAQMVSPDSDDKMTEVWVEELDD